MSIAYKELTGSPVEQYGADGMTATRQFICAWDDRDSFVQDILGEGYQSGVSNPVRYPGTADIVAIKVKVEPLADDLEIQDLGDLAGGLNSYRGFAKVTVSYGKPTVSSTLNVVAGIASQSTFIYSTELTYDTVTLPGENYICPAIPKSRFHPRHKARSVFRSQNIFSPGKACRICLGLRSETAKALGTTPISGAAAGTLLFDGAKAKGVFSSISSLSECPAGCDLEYTFRENPFAAQSSMNLFSTSDFSLLLQAEKRRKL